MNLKSESTLSNEHFIAKNKENLSGVYSENIKLLPIKSKSLDLANGSIYSRNTDYKNIMKSLNQFNKKMNKNEKQLHVEEIKENFKKQWHMLANVIDRLLMIVFLSLMLFSLGSILFQVPQFIFLNLIKLYLL
jgi:hypothetical protein